MKKTLLSLMVIMMTTLFTSCITSSGKYYQLEAKPFSSGGEGDVYSVIKENDNIYNIRK